MDKKHKGQLEINDLIGDAVNNAVARRSQIDSESALSALSDEQVRSIAGGLKDVFQPIGIRTPATLGYYESRDTSTKS